MEPLFAQLRAAREEIGAKLLGSGTVGTADLAPSVEKLERARRALMEDWTQAALETRAVLTPAQLAKAGDVKQKLDGLHAQMQQLFGGPPADPGDEPVD